jgi:cell division transport system ATP-binding protein
MIDIKHASVEYTGGVKALDDVDLCVRAKEFVFVVGPTGAGKSTLLKLLYRGEAATSGYVSVAGCDLSMITQSEIPFFRRKLGIVFQDYGLLPNKTVWENIAFALRVTGVSRTETRSRVNSALEMVGMNHRPDAIPSQISGGEQQRVAIARAIVNDPPLLIADEPTGNLDPETSLGIVQLLKYINERGTTVVVATHDSMIVNTMKKRVVAVVNGKIARDELGGDYGFERASTDDDFDESSLEDEQA